MEKSAWWKGLSYIHCFAVDATRVDAGYKLSQNRNDADHENIVRELKVRGDDNSLGVAKAMQESFDSQRKG
jgi:predicted FMN-binding regulatory protein PaiB